HMAAQATHVSVTDVATIVKALMQPDYSGRRSASAQWQLELAVVEACQHFVSGDNRPEVRPGSAAASSPAPPRRATAPATPRPAVPAPAPAPVEPVEAIPREAEDAGAASGPTARPADAPPPAQATEAVPPAQAADEAPPA